ncbi:hypothetical protein D3C80_731550 [compost metagenome]
MAKRPSSHNSPNAADRQASTVSAAGKNPEQKIYTNRFRGWARSTPIAHASAISTGRPTSNKPFTPSAARSWRPSTSKPSWAMNPPSTASGQSSNSVTAVMPMKWYDTPVSKSRRTNHKANRQNTVPNSRCWRRRSVNSSTQRTWLAAQISNGT